MENEISTNSLTVFKRIKQVDAAGDEFWSALEYSEFRHFKPTVERAKEACKNSGINALDHFEDILEMVPTGSGEF